MEHVSINGSVVLNQGSGTVDVINKLRNINFKGDFEKDSYLRFIVNGNVLSVKGEGVIDGDTANYLKGIFDDLSDCIANKSYIVINRCRWELIVKLYHEADSEVLENTIFY